MIWACDTKGRATYLSPEWLTLTGLSQVAARRWGWLDAVHPEDREVVHSVVIEAATAAVEFTTTFRMRTRDGQYTWVRGSAMPSFSPEDGRFLGFLGSVSEVHTNGNEGAGGTLGQYQAPGSMTASSPQSVVERIADHLLMARALAAEAGEEMLRSILDMGLLEAGQRLAGSQGKASCSALN
jgi:PAS domain S-box-containing protein